MAARKKSKKSKRVKKAIAGGIEYLAGKRLTLPRDGETIVVMPGEPVPEVSGFKNLPSYLKTGAVIGLVDGVPIRESMRHIGRIQKSPAWKHFTEKKAKGTQVTANKKASAARAGGRKSKAETGGWQSEKSDTAGTAAKVSKKTAAKKSTTKKASKKKAAAKAPKRKTGGKKKTRRRRREA